MAKKKKATPGPTRTDEVDDEMADDAALAAALAAADGDAGVWEGEAEGDGGVTEENQETETPRCPHIHQANPDKLKGKVFMTCVVRSSFLPLFQLFHSFSSPASLLSSLTLSLPLSSLSSFSQNIEERRRKRGK